MKAIVLVGGYGTRMRPLTFHCPKPIFPFLNKTPVQYMVEALAKVGVVEVILGINCQSHHKSTQGHFEPHQTLQATKVVPINQQAEQIIKQLSHLQQRYKIKITYSQKHEALGTAGPLKFAEKQLRENNTSGMFFVFNSDIICDYPLKQLLDFHKQHGKEGSILLANVQDPSRYGVILKDQDGRIQNFVQKPKQFIGNQINAGIYVLNLSVLDRIPQQFCMIERQIYPQMAKEGQLYAMGIKDNFWFDIGKPEDYIKAQGAYLEYHKVNTHPQYKSNIYIHESTQIGPDCKLGPNVAIGPNCKIGSGVRLSNCAIIANSTIGNYAHINNTIISWNCTIGSNVRIQGLTAIAEDVEVKDEVRITECMICSHKVIASNCEKEILM